MSKSPYYTRQRVRKKIDAVLEQNAIAWANVGKETTFEDKKKLNKECNDRLVSVLHLDTELIQGLLEATDKYE